MTLAFRTFSTRPSGFAVSIIEMSEFSPAVQSKPVIYDEASRSLPVRELAALTFRRAMGSAMLAVLGAGVALAIVLPMRISIMPELRLIVFAIPPAILLPVMALLFWLRRSPPAAAIERYSKVIAAKREEGAPVAAVSRTFIAVSGVAAFAFALGLLMIIPM